MADQYDFLFYIHIYTHMNMFITFHKSRINDIYYGTLYIKNLFYLQYI